MNLPDNVQQKSDESVFGYFARTLSEEASECRKRIQSTSAASFMLLISILMYSVISLYNINSGLSAIILTETQDMKHFRSALMGFPFRSLPERLKSGSFWWD